MNANMTKIFKTTEPGCSKHDERNPGLVQTFNSV